jgi:hypothetical protein
MLIGLSWHIVRMDDTRTVKKVLEGKPRRGRKKRKSRLRWVDDVESNMRNMGAER